MTQRGEATVGVDIGGTKIAAALVDEFGAIVDSQRRATPSGGATAVLGAVAELVERLPAAREVAAVGVGAPGAVDVTTGVVQSATEILPGWAGAPVASELRRHLGVPVTVDNDVRVMAYGESRRGAGRGHEHVLYVSVGTGVGGAITRGGRLVRGERGTVGEIAHLLVPRRGALPCGCGRLDHLEAAAAGPAITAEYVARTGETAITLPDISMRMRSGDRQARAVIRDAATLLGRTLAGFVTATDLDAVIVGGGVARIGADFLTPLATAMENEVPPAGRTMPLWPTALGPDAPLIGAALLAADHMAETTGAC